MLDETSTSVAGVRDEGRRTHFSLPFSLSPSLLLAFPATEPPSAPQNLTGSVVDQQTVMLTWSAPKFLGGRNDTLYRIECDACDAVAASFVPAREALNETRVLVTGLSPATTYRFLVYAENGASGHDASQFSDVSLTTEAASGVLSSPSSPSSSSKGTCVGSRLPSCLLLLCLTSDPVTRRLGVTGDHRRRLCTQVQGGGVSSTEAAISRRA